MKLNNIKTFIMKHFRLFAATMAVFTMVSMSNIQAQPTKQGGWQQRMMSEKIAFITMKLKLTPEEAQVFWPVYNQIAEKKAKSQKAVKSSYQALVKALHEENISDKELDKLLDAYLEAKMANKEYEKGEADQYRKVLSSKKVAQLYIAEENFRRQHIQNLGGKKGNGHGAPHGNGTRPERCPAQSQNSNSAR